MEYLFGDVLEIKNGKNQKAVENPEGMYPIYGSGGVIGRADNYICEADTVVIGRKGSINNPIYVGEPFWNVDTAFGLEANQEVLLPRYLYYFCKYFDFERLNKAVTIPSLTKTDLLKINIDVPPLEKQKAIVEQLLGIDAIIYLRQEELQKMDDLIKARFVEMFGDSEYESVLLIDTIKHGVGLSYGIVVPGDNVDDGVPMIRPSDFSNGILDLTNVYRVSKEIECKYVKTRLAGDEILVQVIGQPGQVMLATDECKGMNVTRNLAVIRPNHKMVNRLYLKQYMEKGESQQFLLKNTKQSTLKQLPLNLLKQLEVQLPPIELQNQFADFVTQVNKSKVIKQNNQVFS